MIINPLWLMALVSITSNNDIYNNNFIVVKLKVMWQAPLSFLSIFTNNGPFLLPKISKMYGINKTAKNDKRVTNLKKTVPF